MEETAEYSVEITRSAKIFYLEILDHFYKYSSADSASKKADELYEKALTLETFPERGQIEDTLQLLSENHRYILYHSSSHQAIKIIYFIDKPNRRVYVTDFFPTEMDNRRLVKRHKC